MATSNSDLIEHLAQFDGDFKVKVRDPNNPHILHDISLHAVQLEEFVASSEPAAIIARKIRSGELKPELVVVIG